MMVPAVDCHVHVFDPLRFPYAPSAAYQPSANETATVEQLIAVLDAHGISHALVVTPTAGYGDDNRATEGAIASFPERLRGIAVLPPNASETELARLKATGFVGTRLDLVSSGAALRDRALRRLLGLLREMSMVLDLQVEGGILESLEGILRHEAGTVVIDHLGRPDPAQGISQPGFRTLLCLAETGRVAVKLSGPFRLVGIGFPYAAADPFAHAILETYGTDNCVWGSDWPYVGMNHRIDYGPSLDTLSRWVPDVESRRRILWDTPHRLFGFGEPV